MVIEGRVYSVQYDTAPAPDPAPGESDASGARAAQRRQTEPIFVIGIADPSATVVRIAPRPVTGLFQRLHRTQYSVSGEHDLLQHFAKRHKSGHLQLGIDKTSSFGMKTGHPGRSRLPDRRHPEILR